MIRRLMGYLSFGAWYVTQRMLRVRQLPLMGGLVLNETCNLSCSHCRLANRPDVKDLTKAQAQEGILELRERGSRFLAITGGEPMLWESEGFTLEDLVRFARSVGFELISIYTNGTLPLVSSADVLFVSIDGLPQTQDVLRGSVDELIMFQLSRTTHPYICANITINRKNFAEIESLCRRVADIAGIKAIFFYLHTPYYGIDDLFLPPDMRNEALSSIIRLKQRGYPIMNSISCLKGVQRGRWKRPGTLCDVFANGKVYSCCRANGIQIACDNCGYLGYAELEYIHRLNPDTILNTLRYLP